MVGVRISPVPLKFHVHRTMFLQNRRKMLFRFEHSKHKQKIKLKFNQKKEDDSSDAGALGSSPLSCANCKKKPKENVAIRFVNYEIFSSNVLRGKNQVEEWGMESNRIRRGALEHLNCLYGVITIAACCSVDSVCIF